VSEPSGWQLASESVAEASERYLMSTFGYAWTQALVQLAMPQEGDRVLDVACGTGPVARYIAPFVGSTGRVVGLDLNSGMLDTARAMPVPAGVSIEWREGNATALPFPNAGFDVVCCQQGLQFFPDRPAALREMHRVLAPNWAAGFGFMARSRASTFLRRIDESPGTLRKLGGCCEPEGGVHSHGPSRYSRIGRPSGISRYSDQDQKSAYPVSVPCRICAGLFIRDTHGRSGSCTGRCDP